MWNGVVSVVTDHAVLEALASIAPILIAAAFKRVRYSARKALDRFLKSLVHGSNHGPGDKDIETCIRIQEEIALLRLKTKATRVAVYQFHNGDEFSFSNPIFKFTCTHESDEAGVRPDSEVVKNYLVSSYIQLFAPFIQGANSFTWIDEVEGCKLRGVSGKKGASICSRIGSAIKFFRYDMTHALNCPFKVKSDYQGVKIMYATLLYTEKMNPIGIVTFQYNNNNSEDFHSVSLCDICDSTLKVQNLLLGN